MRFASIALQTLHDSGRFRRLRRSSRFRRASKRRRRSRPSSPHHLSPHRGRPLIIEGRIDSHIYDYIQYEAARVAAVRVIELDSLGGNAEWALMIARKVKELGKTTELRSQHYCASACVAIFAAGRERIAAEDTWIGIHGARLGPGYTTNFEGLCFEDLEGGMAFEPRKSGLPEVPESLVRRDAGEHQRSLRPHGIKRRLAGICARPTSRCPTIPGGRLR